MFSDVSSTLISSRQSQAFSNQRAAVYVSGSFMSYFGLWLKAGEGFDNLSD